VTEAPSGTGKPDDVARLRDQAVDELVKNGTIVSGAVEAAMRSVPRHLFTPEAVPEEAYDPFHAVVTRRDGEGNALSSVSDMHVQAWMLEQAAIEPGMRVLEIGPTTVGPPTGGAGPGSRGAAPAARHPWKDQTGPAPSGGEQAPRQAIDERQQHPEMVPSTLPIPQQNTSSHHETEFPSGTGFEPTVDRIGSYFECLFYSAIEWAYQHSITEIDYGIWGIQAKAERRCDVEEISSWYLPTDSSPTTSGGGA
jgi:Protein-L-isoaspartate(D-aspartate) O-methyltransferase (PCMT)